MSKQKHRNNHHHHHGILWQTKILWCYWGMCNYCQMLWWKELSWNSNKNTGTIPAHKYSFHTFTNRLFPSKGVLLIFISLIWILSLKGVTLLILCESSTLVCASSYVSSENLEQSRQSHTGCICLIFLHCVLSNVSSNFPHEKRQSHIGCICLTFLHCVFSNVFSIGLPE